MRDADLAVLLQAAAFSRCVIRISRLRMKNIAKLGPRNGFQIRTPIWGPKLGDLVFANKKSGAEEASFWGPAFRNHCAEKCFIPHDVWANIENSLRVVDMSVIGLGNFIITPNCLWCPKTNDHCSHDIFFALNPCVNSYISLV